MKRLLLVALVLAPLSAFAQEHNYTLTLSNAELTVIGNALGERPYKEVNPVIQSLTRQMHLQNAAEAKAAEKKAEDEKKAKEQKPKEPLHAPTADADCLSHSHYLDGKPPTNCPPSDKHEGSTP